MFLVCVTTNCWCRQYSVRAIAVKKMSTNLCSFSKAANNRDVTAESSAIFKTTLVIL